jgi:FkbM family methyltransferase
MKLTGEAPLQLVRVRDNVFAYADMSDGFLRLIPIEGGYDLEFFRVCDPIMAQGGVFLDVGANHGLLSFGLEGKHPGKIDYHLFEPNPKLIDSIEKSLVHFPGMRCTINAVAVADAPGEVSFEVNEGQTGASHISSEGQGLKVQCITLDDYLQSAGLGFVDLLKLDVEGFELPALKGVEAALRNRTIGVVYFEYFEKWLRRVGPPEEVISFLDACGYEVCFCRGHDLDAHGGPTHRLTTADLKVLPVRGRTLPAMTDLLAAPKENITPAAN